MKQIVASQSPKTECSLAHWIASLPPQSLEGCGSLAPSRFARSPSGSEMAIGFLCLFLMSFSLLRSGILLIALKKNGAAALPDSE